MKSEELWEPPKLYLRQRKPSGGVTNNLSTALSVDLEKYRLYIF